MPVALISTSTSPAFGPATSTSSIVSGLPAAHATAARVFIGGGLTFDRERGHITGFGPVPFQFTETESARRLTVLPSTATCQPPEMRLAMAVGAAVTGHSEPMRIRATNSASLV